MFQHLQSPLKPGALSAGGRTVILLFLTLHVVSDHSMGNIDAEGEVLEE